MIIKNYFIKRLFPQKEMYGGASLDKIFEVISWLLTNF